MDYISPFFAIKFGKIQNSGAVVELYLSITVTTSFNSLIKKLKCCRSQYYSLAHSPTL